MSKLIINFYGKVNGTVKKIPHSRRHTEIPQLLEQQHRKHGLKHREPKSTHTPVKDVKCAYGGTIIVGDAHTIG